MDTQKGNRALIDFVMLVILLFLSGISTSYAQGSNLLTARIQEYATLYPEIHFLHMQGDANSPDIRRLPVQLGENAINLDYEHDPSVREELLQLQFVRIRYLLRNRIPSATLFQTGRHATYTQPYVCALTLDETLLLNHPNASAQFMLSDVVWDGLPVKEQSSFDNNTFLLYTIDHEVYHCLDAYLHGPGISRDTDDTMAAYQHFLSEYRADLYASLTMRQANPTAIEFLNLLASYRIMGRLNFDTEHYTVAAIRQVIHMSESEMNNTNLVGIAESIQKLAQASEPGITEYSHLINAARGLALYLGIEEGGFNVKKNATQDHNASPQLSLIIKEFEGAQAHITSNVYLEDDFRSVD